ncbi:UNVERIFIED_CONTAM: hypothetical protein GTU68_017400 [Idotea baltica]|nr:hypothetical protein [Idotea baltica]
MNYTKVLNKLFDAAVTAALPEHHIVDYLPAKPLGRTLVVGAGKASAAMAKALESHWQGDLTGLVVVPHGPHPICQSIEIGQANHPVPDEAGEAYSKRILHMVSNLDATDLVISLISGGGSSLLSLPGMGISLADKQAVNVALLKSGAAIDEMNCVRKHLSAIKGGRLAAAAYPASMVTLAVSDVPGDDLSIIASGPTVPNATTREHALKIIERYNIALPENVAQLLNSDAANTPTVSDKNMSKATAHLICKPQQSLEAAAKHAQELGLHPIILGDAIEGEAREVGKVMAGIALQVSKYDQPVKKPAVLISGGETTVTVRKKGGRGGRNAEFLLGFVESAQTLNNLYAIAADTDGIDGTEDNAGVIWNREVAQAATEQGLNSSTYLDNNDAWSFFNAANGLVMRGPTHTNVNDFRAIIIE